MAALVVMSSLALPVAAHTSADADKTLQEDGTYWAGQSLLVQAPNATEQTVELYNKDTGEFVSQYKTDSHGEFVLDTAELDGNYVVKYADGNTTNFTVYQQTLSASASESSVTNGDSDNANWSVTVDSNRAEYDLNVSADGLTASEIANLTAAQPGTDYTVHKDAGVVTFHNVSDGDFKFDFTGVDKGDYAFQFNSTDTPASASSTVTVGDAAEIDAAFGQDSYSDDAGDKIKFTVDLTQTDSAVVTIGNESEIGYETTFEVVDKNDDGKVTVLFNTFTAGKSGYTPVAVPSDSTDSVNVTYETDLSNELASASYSASVQVNGEEKDLSVIEVSDAGHGDVSVFSAPADKQADTLSGIAKVASKDSEIARQDKVVFEIPFEGASGYFTDSVTAADLANGYMGLTVSINETDATTDRNSEPVTLDVSKATLVQDHQNDTIYLVYDTSDLPSSVEDGDEFRTTLTVDQNNPYVDSEDAEFNVSNTFSVTERSVSLDGVDDGSVTYERTANDTIVVSGDASVADGTSLTVEVRNNNVPFLMSQKVTVQDGAFSAEFNFSDVPAESSFTVQVVGQTGKVDASVKPHQTPTPTPTETETETATETPTETATPEPTETATPEPTEKPDTATPTPADSSDDSSKETTSTNAPGFGVAVSLIAVIGAALLAVRRD